MAKKIIWGYLCKNILFSLSKQLYFKVNQAEIKLSFEELLYFQNYFTIKSYLQVTIILGKNIQLYVKFKFEIKIKLRKKSKMFKQSSKQQQRQIERLKSILFPKKKLNTKPFTDNSFTQSQEQNHRNKQQTRQQNQFLPNENKLSFQQTRHLLSNQRRKNINISNLQIANHNYHNQDQDECLSQFAAKDNSTQKTIIKNQIHKLKHQMDILLHKCRQEYNVDYYQQLKHKSQTNQSINSQNQPQSNNNYDKKKQQHFHMRRMTQEQQELTQRHYLNRINQINKNLQKYNAYMYGIKQASQQMIQSLPFQKDQNILSFSSNSYKIYYFSLLLTNYVVDKINKGLKNQIKSSFQAIITYSQLKKQIQQQREYQSKMNQPKVTFLRKNLLDKGFKKWRLNSKLLSFQKTIFNRETLQNASIIQSRSNVSLGQQNRCPNNQGSFQLLKSKQMIKNILKKQKLVINLKNYLIQNVLNQSKIKPQIDILLLSQKTAEAYTFFDQDSFNQDFGSRIKSSRLQNVIESEYSEFQYKNNHLSSSIKRFNIKLKNSLTKMCIDSRKIVRVSQLSQNQLFNFQVDSPVLQQLWIRTCNTQRNFQINSRIQNKNQNKQEKYAEKIFLKEQVYYDSRNSSLGVSMTKHFGSISKFDDKKLSKNVIFYPIIYNSEIIGVLRQFIYEQQEDNQKNNLMMTQIPTNILELIAEVIFTSYELDGYFESLKIENQILERKYALKTVKLIRNLQNLQTQKSTKLDNEQKNIQSSQKDKKYVLDKQYQNQNQKNIVQKAYMFVQQNIKEILLHNQNQAIKLKLNDFKCKLRVYNLNTDRSLRNHGKETSNNINIYPKQFKLIYPTYENDTQELKQIQIPQINSQKQSKGIRSYRNKGKKQKNFIENMLEKLYSQFFFKYSNIAFIPYNQGLQYQLLNLKEGHQLPSQQQDSEQVDNDISESFSLNLIIKPKINLKTINQRQSFYVFQLYCNSRIFFKETQISQEYTKSGIISNKNKLDKIFNLLPDQNLLVSIINKVQQIIAEKIQNYRQQSIIKEIKLKEYKLKAKQQVQQQLGQYLLMQMKNLLCMKNQLFLLQTKDKNQQQIKKSQEIDRLNRRGFKCLIDLINQFAIGIMSKYWSLFTQISRMFQIKQKQIDLYKSQQTTQQSKNQQNKQKQNAKTKSDEVGHISYRILLEQVVILVEIRFHQKRQGAFSSDKKINQQQDFKQKQKNIQFRQKSKNTINSTKSISQNILQHSIKFQILNLQQNQIEIQNKSSHPQDQQSQIEFTYRLKQIKKPKFQVKLTQIKFINDHCLQNLQIQNQQHTKTTKTMNMPVKLQSYLFQTVQKYIEMVIKSLKIFNYQQRNILSRAQKDISSNQLDKLIDKQLQSQLRMKSLNFFKLNFSNQQSILDKEQSAIKNQQTINNVALYNQININNFKKLINQMVQGVKQGNQSNQYQWNNQGLNRIIQLLKDDKQVSFDSFQKFIQCDRQQLIQQQDKQLYCKIFGDLFTDKINQSQQQCSSSKKRNEIHIRLKLFLLTLSKSPKIYKKLEQMTNSANKQKITNLLTKISKNNTISIFKNIISQQIAQQCTQNTINKQLSDKSQNQNHFERVSPLETCHNTVQSVLQLNKTIDQQQREQKEYLINNLFQTQYFDLYFQKRSLSIKFQKQHFVSNSKQNDSAQRISICKFKMNKKQFRFIQQNLLTNKLSLQQQLSTSETFKEHIISQDDLLKPVKDRNQQLIHQVIIKRYFCIVFNEWFNFTLYQKNISNIKKIAKAVQILSYRNFLNNQSKQQNQINSHSDQKISTQLHNELAIKTIQNKINIPKKGLLLKNLQHTFNLIKQNYKSSVHKSKIMLKLSKLINNYSRKRVIYNSISKWQVNVKQIKHDEVVYMIKDKILSNSCQYHQKLSSLIHSIDRHLCGKILVQSIRKIYNYARYNRLSDKKNYRLKCLQNHLQRFTQYQMQKDKKLLTHFFKNCMQIFYQKKKNDFININIANTFQLIIQNSYFFKTKIFKRLKNAFSLIKGFYYNDEEKNRNRIQNTHLMGDQNQKVLTINQKINQCKSFNQLSHILKQQLPQYDIWIRPFKRTDKYIKISTGINVQSRPSQLDKVDEIFYQDNYNICSQTDRYNILQAGSQQITKSQNVILSKQNILDLYFEQNVSVFQSTSFTIYISSQDNKINSQGQSLNSTFNLTNNNFQLNGLNIYVHDLNKSLQNHKTNQHRKGLGFKQKQKLNNLSKQINRFIKDYKKDLTLKIDYLNTIFDSMRNKRYQYSLKKCKKYNQNMRLLSMYQMNDTIYQLNVENENIKQKLKIQSKIVAEQKNEYNKLCKKQSQINDRIQKYNHNINSLAKMLLFYQEQQKKKQYHTQGTNQHAIKKTKLIQRHRTIPSLCQQQKNVINLAFMKWRQVNAQQKIMQLKRQDLRKAGVFLIKTIKWIQKQSNKRLMKIGFQQILCLSVFLQHKKKQQEQRQYREILKRKKMQEEKRRQQQIQCQRQRKIQQKMIVKKRKMYESQFQSHRTDNQFLDTLQSKKITYLQSDKYKKNQNNSYFDAEQEVYNQDGQQNQNYYDHIQKSLENYYIDITTNRKQGPYNLAEQLQSQFNQLNGRLMTFQKNFITQTEDELQNQAQRGQKQQALGNYQAPNNGIQSLQYKTQQFQKQGLSQLKGEQKVKFQLQKMRMKKSLYNKQNLTVTSQEYEKINKGSNYKLGSKTLRFLKRMGKIDDNKQK